jgi:hypothetical protein
MARFGMSGLGFSGLGFSGLGFSGLGKADFGKVSGRSVASLLLALATLGLAVPEITQDSVLEFASDPDTVPALQPVSYWQSTGQVCRDLARQSAGCWGPTVQPRHSLGPTDANALGPIDPARVAASQQANAVTPSRSILPNSKLPSGVIAARSAQAPGPSGSPAAEPIDPSELTPQERRLQAAPIDPVSPINSQTCGTPVSPWSEGIQRAASARQRVKTARTSADWSRVMVTWLQAIDSMDQVPKGRQWVAAQGHKRQYQAQLASAEQRLIDQGLPFKSFGQAVLDRQLLRFLAYEAAWGTPDVLIVGSSRALQGVDPEPFSTAKLAAFNLGVNGATAQVVDGLLRQVLRPEQLPRSVVWADGLRAFNDSRRDRTYEQLIASPGYVAALAGQRPSLPIEAVQVTWGCETPSRTKEGGLQEILSAVPTGLPTNLPIKLTELNPFAIAPAQAAQVPQVFQGGSNINRGFVSIADRFDPSRYYRRFPKVLGRYDSDYRELNLDGIQGQALTQLAQHLRQQRIALTVINLPLSSSYLDLIRQDAETRFDQRMLQQAAQSGFSFVNWVADRELTADRYFADPSHLNQTGAQAVSQRLIGQGQLQLGLAKQPAPAARRAIGAVPR